jgi:hypothetical protein
MASQQDGSQQLRHLHHQLVRAMATTALC